MDIPYTEHSHLIGKGGARIQNIMKETKCHIHFPDSNRTNMTEKNNWVSITGQPSGVVRARCKLRGKRILVTARGVQNQFERFQKGLHVLMDYLTLKDDLPVTLKTDIDLKNHQAVMGPGSINIERIKRNCHVDIVFQSAIPTTASSQVCSGVYISGAFDNVYKAWKQLTNNLPLKLCFDLKKGQDIFPDHITRMMSEYNVNIMTRLKKKENVKIITVQGVESGSRNLFKVRKQMLNLDESEVPVCCDEHLDSDSVTENSPTSFAYGQSNPIQNLFSDISNPFFTSYVWSSQANYSYSSWFSFTAVEE